MLRSTDIWPSHIPIRRFYYALGGLGFLARIALWHLSEGSNDIRTWYRFAELVEWYGIGWTYRIDPLFNHPPLMGFLARACLHIAPRIGLTFGPCFKLFGMFADMASALLLIEIWRRRGQLDQGARAFAAYGCALSAILISSYHGNTDSAYWFLTLAAVYLLEDRRAPLLAGLTLGAALNVKLIPILVVLPLAASCRDRKEFVRFTLGGIIALLPFAIIVAGFIPAERAALYRNVFGYASYREHWGIEVFERALDAAFQISAPDIIAPVDWFGAFYARNGSKILMAVTTALALWQWRSRRGLDTYAMVALCYSLFLVLASGFGVQYVGVAVPFLIARRVREGFAVGTMAGIFIGLIYCSFVRTWTPIYSQHSFFPPTFAPAAFATWWLLARACLRIWRTRTRRAFGESGTARLING
jgi:hypothetical protein